MAKNSSSAGRRENRAAANDTADSSRPISSVAMPMNDTISPTLASPCTCSTVPTATITMTATVLDARVSTLTSAHQFSTGNWWRMNSAAMSLNSRVSAVSRVNACTTITLDSASCAVPDRAELSCSALSCPASVRWITTAVTETNTTTSTISTAPSFQLMNSVIGSSTTADRIVARWSRKNVSQTPNSDSDPAIIAFISRPDWVSP